MRFKAVFDKLFQFFLLFRIVTYGFLNKAIRVEFENFLKEIERQDVDHLAKVAGVDKQLVKEAAIA